MRGPRHIDPRVVLDRIIDRVPNVDRVTARFRGLDRYDPIYRQTALSLIHI